MAIEIPGGSFVRDRCVGERQRECAQIPASPPKIGLKIQTDFYVSCDSKIPHNAIACNGTLCHRLRWYLTTTS